MASAQGLEGVAAGASARVGEILAEAERHGREARAEAERAAAAIRRDAEREVERIGDEARESARAAARERAERLAELQAALTARGPAVVEGLEGEGLTRARLEAVIEALSAAAQRVTSEAEAGDPGSAAATADDSATAASEAAASPGTATPETAAGDEEPDGAATEPEPDSSASAEREPEPVAPEGPPEGSDLDPVAAAEDLAKPFPEAPADGDADAPSPSNGDDATRYAGPLPEGAPMARRPRRSPERDARFAALLLAVQGRARHEVDAHLRTEYGFDDVEPILDEVFGPAAA